MTHDDRAEHTPQDVHLERDRAESFGSIAADYERFRPPYPDALFTELAGRGGVDVLDVGCGTGKASTLLAARDLRVLGVEVDPAMAAIARTHGIDVETGSFEQWDDAGRRFDLITAAQSWHWVDPVAGAAKAARLLRSGGSIALFWNVHELDDDVRDRIDEIYRDVAPSLHDVRRGGVRGRIELYGAPLTDAGFAGLETREYPWQHAYARADFTGLLATYSDHHLLPDDVRSDLLDAVGALVDELGGSVTVHYETHALLARRP